MNLSRFRKAEEILIKGKYFLEAKGESAFFFIVDDSEDKKSYKIIISENKCLCTCEYGSIWGVKKMLPCSHIIACIGAILKVEGPMLRKRWANDILPK